jgi:branched-chain amino acid transport system substrate-binding protein
VLADKGAETLRNSITRPWRAFALVAILAIVAAACGDDAGSGGGDGAGGGQQAAKNVAIGFFGAQTGDNAQLGINISNAVKLAVDEHNKKGGTQVELKIYDTQGDPAQAPGQANKAITEVVAIIGPAFSGESRAADPTFEAAKIPFVSPSATNTQLSANGWQYFYRVLANDGVQGPAVADYIAKKLQAKNVAVIDDASEYGKGLADEVRSKLKGAGVKLVVGDSGESVDPRAPDYSSTVNKVKGASADAIFYGGYYAEAAKLVKQLRDGGVTATFVSGDGSLDQGLIDGAGPAAEGAIATCPCFAGDLSASDDQAAKAFNDAYQAAYNTAPATYSTEGYDAANAVLKAIEAGKTTGADINAFLKTTDFKGVSKQIKFEPNGEVVAGAIYAYEIKGGKIVNLGAVSELVGG